MMKHNYVILDNKNVQVVGHGAAIPKGEFLDHTAMAIQNTDKGLLSPNTNLQLRDLFMDQFSVRHVNMEFNHDIIFTNQQKPVPDSVESCVYLQGYTHTLTDDLQKGVTVNKGHQNFMFDPWKDYVHRTPAHTPASFIHFVINKDFFIELLPENERWSEDMRSKILRNELILGTPNSTITSIQQQAIQNIISSPLSGSLGKIFIEASFLQFIALHLKTLFQNDLTHEPPKFSKRDKELMHAVREHLTETFTNEHSLVALSRNFGVNESKLTKGFKLTFGQTVFEYIKDLKMDYARRLLEDQGMFVAEVAPIIGYKNANHFSVAFKNKFGFSPSKLKR